MFSFLARLTVNHPWKVCAVWVLVAIGLPMIAPNWRQQAQDDDIRFLPPRFPSVRGYRLLEKAFPQDIFASRAVFAIERAAGPLTQDDLVLVDRMTARLTDLMKDEPALQITGVVSHREPLIGNRLISADKQCVLIQVSLGTPYMATQTRETVDRAEAAVRPILTAAGSSAPRFFVTGPGGIGRDLIRASAESLDDTSLATIILVIVVLLLVYRSPVLALIPLLTIGVATWVAMQILALVTLIPGVHLVNISQVFAIVLIFGAGTDYCLFLIARYREELESEDLSPKRGGEKIFASKARPRFGQGLGRGSPTALGRSVRRVGAALAASAGTVMVGLGLMGFAEFGKIRSAGPVIALGLAVALAASLTLTPALLRLAGRRAFWPRKIQSTAKASGIWEYLSRQVVKRPVLIWSGALLLLLPFAGLGVCVRPTFKPTGDLSPNAESLRGLNVIQKRFPAGETGPITVLLTAKTDWDAPAGRATIDSLCQGFTFLGNVAEIRSLTQPLGRPLPGISDEPVTKPKNALAGLWQNAQKEFGDLLSSSLKKAREHYATRIATGGGIEYVTRLDVVLKSDPFDAASIGTLEEIETWMRTQKPDGVLRAECYGVTVHARDVETVVDSDRIRVNGLVLGGVFLILLVLVRKFWLALYLLATVLLSYFATLGMTTLFASAWYGKPLGQVEWRVPFFLFTILVAVGEDYNILMVTRAIEERMRHGVIEGLRRGLARTGGTITACGVIMAGTFGTLMLGGLGTLIQIGFALAVGVLVDTLLVRPFLVPTFMLIVWRDGLGEKELAAHALPQSKAASVYASRET
jgi:RND superfamily putative drug exporter